MLKKLFKTSSFYLSGLMFGKLLSTVVFIFLARLLAPEIFGKTVLFITYLSLATLLADFGLIQWYQKKIHFFNKKVILNQMFNARIVTLILAIFLMSIVLWVTKPFSVFLNLILLFTLVPEAFLSVTDGYFLAQKQALRISLKQISKMAVVALGLFLFKNNFDLNLFAIFLCTASFITLVWFFPWDLVPNLKLSFKNAVKTLQSAGSYATLIFTSYAYARGDSLIIEYSLGSTFLGLYNMAYRYLEGLSLIPTALSHNLFHLSARKKGLEPQQLLKITLAMATLGSVLSIALFFSASLLTTTLLGENYAPSAGIIKILALVLFLFFVNSPLSTVVQSSKLINQFLPWGIINTIGNLILNISLIPVFGIAAAAWIMLLTEVTGLLINLGFIFKLYRKC